MRLSRPQPEILRLLSDNAMRLDEIGLLWFSFTFIYLLESANFSICYSNSYPP